MTVAAAPTIFDAFNARQLTPAQVANTFVPPPYFDKLINAAHTLIIGPRGSGKTTLLKMLHPAAVEAWQHRQAADYRQRVRYTGVFIATDINWNEQVNHLGDGGLDPDAHRQFAKAAFTTQILQSLVQSMSHRSGRLATPPATLHRRIELTGAVERVIGRELARAWYIDQAVPTLEGISLALSRRLSQIRTVASQEAGRQSAGRAERLASLEYLHLDFLAAAGVAIEVFNAKAKEHGAKWALLFDELELAPKWIRAVLVRCLRSVDDRFLFKISLSPYSVDIKHELEAVDAPGPQQDFDAIRLWYENKEHAYPFCEELLGGMLKARHRSALPSVKIFGRSSFDTERVGRQGKRTAYRTDSEIGRLFRSLAERDGSFRQYLRGRNIDLRAMEIVDGDKRATDLRKVRSVVALRAYFKGAGADLAKQRRQRRRSRKVPTVYGGASSLFAMVEGNPRWFIGIVGQLLTRGTGKVSKPAQVRQVREAANIFRAMLKTIPCNPVGPASRGLLSLLDPVGDYFASATIDEKFDPDPPCSFIVDTRTSEPELRALGMALNAGAIVYAPDEGDVGLLESVRGKRFRLSYILAPHYFTPLVLGRSLSLQEVLRRSAKLSSRQSLEPMLFRPLDAANE